MEKTVKPTKCRVYVCVEQCFGSVLGQLRGSGSVPQRIVELNPNANTDLETVALQKKIGSLITPGSKTFSNDYCNHGSYVRWLLISLCAHTE